MRFNYQQEVLVLPASILNAGADGVQLRVLLWLASDTSLLRKVRQLAKLADCTADEARAAIRFWQEAGAILVEGEGEAIPAMASAEASPQSEEKKPAKPARTLLRRADELPAYTSTELADLLEARASVRVLVDEAQRILGKLFNPSELNILVGMLDYLSLSEESILLLLAHCKRIGKTNLRAIEKYAYSLVDRGITEPAAMEEEIRVLEELHSVEGEIRTLFGMKSRALTERETKMLRAWRDFGYDVGIVRLAYELTVNATGEPSLPYANAILERWNAEGLRNEEEIRASIEASAGDAEGARGQGRQKGGRNGRNEKTGKRGTGEKTNLGRPSLGNSFDTDDFFEAALQRSFQQSDRETGGK